MQGMMNNMLGSSTGDLLGGLLGGGSAGGTASSLLEGSVRFGMDAQFNVIYVSGATGNDLDQIAEFIEVFDQPEPPVDPELGGQFRTIDILHRDPMEIKEIIEAQLSELIDTGDKKSASPKNNEAQQMIRMMQQLAGGKKKGGESREIEKPKVRLGVDPTTSQLLVTGPEFIYKEILKMVVELDKKELSDPPAMQMLSQPGNPDAYKRVLTAMFKDKIEFVLDDEENAAKKATSASTPRKSSSRTNTAIQRQQEQARRAFLNALRQQGRSNSGGRGGRSSSRNSSGRNRRSGGGGGRGGR